MPSRPVLNALLFIGVYVFVSGWEHKYFLYEYNRIFLFTKKVRLDGLFTAYFLQQHLHAFLAGFLAFLAGAFLTTFFLTTICEW